MARFGRAQPFKPHLGIPTAFGDFGQDATGHNNSAATASLTWTHVVGSGPNRALIVGVGIVNALSQTVTGITFGAQNLTKLDAINSGTGARSELWYLVNPTSGSATVTVTVSATAAVAGWSLSLTNVNQGANPFGGSATGSGTGTAISTAVTSSLGYLVIDNVAAATTSETVGASQNQFAVDGIATLVDAGSDRAATAGSNTMSWTAGASVAWAQVVGSLQPVNVSNAVNAPAGLASGTGAANNASVAEAPTAGNASGTGAASNPAPKLATSAGAGTGTGAAGGPTANVTSSPSAATGTGSAGNAAPSLGPNAGLGSGTGATGAPSPKIAPTAGLASGTGTASNASAGDRVSNASSATGTGQAGNPSPSIAPTGSAASATGSANNPSPLLATNAGAGTGTAAAGGPSSAIAVSPSTASGTGAAFDATVSITSSSKNAFAQLASGTGAAFDATVLLVENSSATGGNLVKPRLHQGNAPGRKQQKGEGSLLYTLTVTGSGTITTETTLTLARLKAEGSVTSERHIAYTHRRSTSGALCVRKRVDLELDRRYVGAASEDPEDILLLALL